ncbi:MULTISPECIES: hypothetical protein [Sinorhizobium]|jgi:hypothetical protein|uniref:MetS family NSS transporter small subunit n=1 Tax=Sinorhizobium kummerowiae TaxID=158892 RepID=A0ABY8T9N9_9HYPH|nr:MULTISPECIES: hypothetical protein [Sinorhizobium]WHS94619.1 hypothetical protein PZL22_002355 [Sinorhizobium kummerowiae]
MTWSILIASAGAVLWMAALTLIVPGFVEREFRRNGYRAKD